MGDKSQLLRALSNLVSNAIKFTPSGGAVTVCSRNGKDSIALQVKDTGAGIDKEELSRLFSEYQRLKSADNIAGTGLGLFIVKSIVEAHHGSVNAESKVGVGTTFTITLPADKEHSPVIGAI